MTKKKEEKKTDNPGNKSHTCPFGIMRLASGEISMAPALCRPECKFARQVPAEERWSDYDPEEDFGCVIAHLVGHVARLADAAQASIPGSLSPSTPIPHEEKEEEPTRKEEDPRPLDLHETLFGKGSSPDPGPGSEEGGASAPPL